MRYASYLYGAYPSEKRKAYPSEKINEREAMNRQHKRI